MKALLLKSTGFLAVAIVADSILTYHKTLAPAWAYYIVGVIFVATCIALIKYGNELCFWGRINDFPAAILYGRICLVVAIPIIVIGYTIAITPGSPTF